MMSFYACVGTIADKNSQKSSTVTSGTTDTNITFGGLIKANPISHSKVELSFYPAKGNSSEYTYEIYVNGAPFPVKISSNSISPNSTGQIVAIVDGLNLNSTYTFNIKAIAAGIGSSSILDPKKTLSATTFSNETANFLGIANAQLSPGVSSQNSVIVSWLPATITGSTSRSKSTDPVTYEITYISTLGGLGRLNDETYPTTLDRKVIYTTELSSLQGNDNPPVDRTISKTITGLNPGTTYFFQVRAIHKNFMLYGSDAVYKKELNTKYIKITTQSSTGAPDFKPEMVTLSNAIGVDGLTRLNVAWLPASGPFYNYRVCYKKVANENILPEDVDISDQLVNNSNFPIAGDGVITCSIKNAEETFHQIGNLTPYAYYQVKVFACLNSDCDSSNRIASIQLGINKGSLVNRVMTNLAPFGGITRHENPSSTSYLNKIKLHFDPAVVTTGYMNKFRLYCYRNLLDSNPVRLMDNESVSSNTGINICDNITVHTDFPESIDEIQKFSSIELSLPSTSLEGNTNLCFALVPAIESTHLNQFDLTTATVKCFTPQILAPTIVQFPGRDISCDITNGTDLNIIWPTPTGGLYTHFVTFYQAKTIGTEFFSFENAINEFSSNQSINYNWIVSNDHTATNQLITNLTPGGRYNVGVMAYLDTPSIKKWSQYNLSVGECAIPLPKAKFKEWTQVFAIGPKENGLVPKSQSGNREYILETIDTSLSADGIPYELKLDSDKITPLSSEALSHSKNGSNLFDGIYGRLDNLTSNTLHQYSNNGIVKIMWKDVNLFGTNTKHLKDYYDNALKKDRKFGYRIYRSDDNKITWINLTQNSLKNTNQKTTNDGLIQAIDVQWRVRNNSNSITESMASFTDYSVNATKSNDMTDKARVYYYKIVPVFNNNELVYDDVNNPNHHVIKVILPPRNMALVHRLMANRNICLEMDKSISKKATDFYTCEYNGLGSSGKNGRAIIGETVYDQGGDLLVDRFELGVNFTRGDPNITGSTSEFNGTKLQFNGADKNGSKFTGCFNNTSTQYEPNQGTPPSGTTYSYQNMIPGDCVGNDKPNTVFTSGDCSQPENYMNTYPGTIGEYITSTKCSDSTYTFSNFGNLSDSNSIIRTDENYFPTQSEYGAVYYIRNYFPHMWNTLVFSKIPAGNNSFLSPIHQGHNINAYINLPFLDNSTNTWVPRWLPISKLFGGYSLNLETDSGSYIESKKFELYNMTISQILSSSLYDTIKVQRPTSTFLSSNRYDNDTPIARIISSNASKLPPLMSLTQRQLSKICSTYKIDVGIESNNTFNSLLKTGQKSKQLLRRKEFIAASSWSFALDDSQVKALEKGQDSKKTGCIGRTKTDKETGLLSMQKNSPYSNYFAVENSSDPGYGAARGFNLSQSITSASSYLVTGSAGDKSSERCISRYGIQDLIGNIAEQTSEEFFCNHQSADALVNKPEIYITPTNDYIDGARYDGTLVDTSLGLKAIVRKYQESGNCSSVEIGGNRSLLFASGSNINSIYLPDSQIINNQVVSKTKDFDQKSILSMRNGDGSFLDFGQDAIGTQLNDANDINTMTPTMYFNIALGIPIVCNKGCNNGEAEDNKRIVSDYHASIASAASATYSDPASIKITNFPINNSTFHNIGVNDIYSSIDANTNDSYRYSNNKTLTFIDAIIQNASLENILKKVTYTSPQPSPGGLTNYRFIIDRKSSVRMISGGNANIESGRYSLHIDGPRDNLDPNGFGTAGRCSILLEE